MLPFCSLRIRGARVHRVFEMLDAGKLDGKIGERSKKVSQKPAAPTYVRSAINVEYLLDVFISIDTSSDNAWNAYAHSVDHLYWRKPRRTALTQRIKTFPDDTISSRYSCLTFPDCLNLVHTFELETRQGDDYRTATTLVWLSDVNRALDFYEDGIQ